MSTLAKRASATLGATNSATGSNTTNGAASLDDNKRSSMIGSSTTESKRARVTPSGLGPGSSPVRRKPSSTTTTTRNTASAAAAAAAAGSIGGTIVDGDALIERATRDPAAAASAAQARRRAMAATNNDDSKRERRTLPSSAAAATAAASVSGAMDGTSSGGNVNMDDIDDDGNPISPPVKLSKKEKLALEKERLASEAEQRRAAYNRMVGLWKDRGARKRAARTAGGPIRFRTNFRNTILDVFKERGWKETDSETDWDIFWTDKEWIRGVYDRVHLDHQQRVNHFRNYFELARKDLLIKNLKRAKRTLAKKGHIEESEQYNFFPLTFSLPGEYLLFVEAFKKTPETNWIMKPVGKSQGKGIFLFDKLSQINEWRNDNRWKPENPQAEKYIVQQYIGSPYLIGGKKFDLRIYLLVTSYAPLNVFIYREGFARFSATRYQAPTHENIGNSYIHLTNVAIQKKGEDYDAASGGKMDLRTLKLYLATKHGAERVNQLFCEIQLVCIRSLQSVSKTMISDKNSFELYGYDILLDSDLKVWLIEVNASPSLTANTPEDYALKMRLLHDTISIVDLDGRLTGTEEQVGGFDLIYRDGFVKFDPNCTVTTYLGANNNRRKQLQRLARSQTKKERPKAEASSSSSSSSAARATDRDRDR